MSPVTGERHVRIPADGVTLDGDQGGPMRIGYFAASTGAAAALEAAAGLGDAVVAIVSRGGRPDLAEGALGRVTAPTLLIVGARDTAVLDLNQRAYEQLGGERKLAIVPGATHLFEEPGALDRWRAWRPIGSGSISERRTAGTASPDPSG